MGKAIDLSGEKYGRLLVIKRVGSRRNRSLWLCQCDCGNYCEITSNDLRTGNNKSCGCLNIEKIIQRNTKDARDFTGERIGSLIAEYKFFKNGNTYWHCKCDCGNETDISGANIGRTKSCGCIRSTKTAQNNTKDLNGMKFGELTAIKRLNTKRNNNWLWLCSCSCGNQIYADTHALASGHKRSCGCIKSEPEEIIRRILERYSIQYIRQKQFIKCRDKNPLYYDFYLPDYNLAIEYDGEFHFRDIEGINDLEYSKRRDAIKTQYCEENDILLLRIPYWEKDNIESILTDWLFLYDEKGAGDTE